jgi:glycosyltransferase involved in cell wall biosynthesis
MESIVDHQRTGLLFKAGSASALVEALQWWDKHPAEAALMRTQARLEYETKYTPESNYAQLFSIYESVLNRSENLSWLDTAGATTRRAGA